VNVIPPGSTLGVLGGGQLGGMFAAAALRMGYRVAVWDPDPNAPAHRLSSCSFTASFADRATVDEFAELVHAITYEWENVPSVLCRELEQRKPLRPSAGILDIIQDRLKQKQFLADNGWPVPRFVAVTEPSRLPEAVEEVGCPAICKTATAGYDGKGQWAIRRMTDVPEIQRSLERAKRAGSRWILEAMVPFERELSILIARGAGGESVRYPLADNLHVDGILRSTVVPAEGPPSLVQRAGDLAVQIVERMGGVGVFCLELFHAPGDALLVNEVAPRPHNSGHYTLDACSVSQFEQQVRAVCGLPLGEVRLLSPAAMLNLIGEEAAGAMSAEGCRKLLAVPGAVLHWYGKQAARPKRKMGHVTFLADSRETAVERVSSFYTHLSGHPTGR